MSSEFYCHLPDGSRLSETTFIKDLPDPLRFELVKTYTIVTGEWGWGHPRGPRPKDEPEEDVEVHGYRVHGADGNVLWAFFWRKLEWEEGQLQRFERYGGNKVTTILETLAKGFELTLEDEVGIKLEDEGFREMHG